MTACARISEGNHPTDLFGFNTLKSGLTSKLQIPFQPKGLHDEMNSAAFDEFGRMTANLGLEAPNANPLLQNIILYPFVNPGTEFIDGTNLQPADVKEVPISSASDGTQIWKITHNGVDTHPIHFHLFDVQVLNRVTWDNIIIPTEPSELGWKDTVRISPLEDTIVALRPVVPQVPFEVPNSIRPLNPMMPLGDTSMFNPVDINGNPTADVVNAIVNFGWEYVYHCHILSHEEMDMMRPVTLALPPIAADGLAFDHHRQRQQPALSPGTTTRSTRRRSWCSGRPTGSSGQVGTSPSPLDAANTHGTRTLTDTTSNASTEYLYRVVAQNTVGYGGEFPSMTVQSISASLAVNPPAAAPLAPTNLTAAIQAGPQVSLTFTDNANNESGFVIERAVGAGAFVQLAAAAAHGGTGATTFVDTTAVLGHRPTRTGWPRSISSPGSSSLGHSNTVIRDGADPAAADDQLRGGQVARRQPADG